MNLIKLRRLALDCHYLRWLAIPVSFFVTTFLSSCQAYQTLGQQSRDNYAYTKRANLEIDILLAERDNLRAERARLQQLAASYGTASRPSRSSSSSSRSSAAAVIQRQIAANEVAIARNEAQIRQARMLAAY